jgi:protein-S-isoprenylcysteine O-methyltransferase Ste14
VLLVLIIAVQALVRWPHPMPTALVVAGIALALAGLAIVFWARVALGGAFTMFPEPKQRDSPVSSGPYRYARHPMYGGLLLLLAGVGLARSLPALVVVAALAVLWWRKSVEEERRLVRTFPGYDEYRRRTRHRFLPLSWPRGHAP